MTKAMAVRSLSQACDVTKKMNLSQDWESDYRAASRQALVALLRDRMDERTDRYLAQMDRSLSDRRNGSFSRHVLTELGDIEITVPRTRTWSAGEVVRAYCRRVVSVDRMILSCFVLGLSTRKVAQALFPVLGTDTLRYTSKALPSAVVRTNGYGSKERLLGAPGRIDPAAQRLQHLGAHMENHLFIIDRENRFSTPQFVPCRFLLPGKYPVLSPSCYTVPPVFA